MPLSDYGVPDTGGYARQASDLQYRYNTDRAQNAYGRFLSQQRGSRNLGDLSREFSQQLPNYKAQFGHRGLAGQGINSGVQQRSMGNYLGDYARTYGRGQQEIAQQLQNYDLQGAQMDAAYNNSVLDLQRNKQSDIANAALAIQALRPYFGGA